MANASATQAKPSAIVEIERLGFGWTEVADFDLTRLSVERRVQAREAKHYAPKETVEQFAVAMGEVAFPPIVVTVDYWIVDGNTRVGAKLRRKEKFSPAIVLDVAFDGVSDKQRDLLFALAATLNQMGGLRLTSKEVRDVAQRLIRLGWKTEEIGRAIGLRPGGVTMVKKEIEAAAKLKRVGLDPNGSAKAASLRALGAKDVVGLNDVPFRELATLAADAGLNASEISSTAKEARATGSDTGAVDVIAKLRTELGDRIQEVKLTGVGKPPMSRQLRQHLGFVTKFHPESGTEFAGREQELIETDPKVNDLHLETLAKALWVLSRVLEMQTGG
jgi:hypothetical protein